MTLVRSGQPVIVGQALPHARVGACSLRDLSNIGCRGHADIPEQVQGFCLLALMFVEEQVELMESGIAAYDATFFVLYTSRRVMDLRFAISDLRFEAR